MHVTVAACTSRAVVGRTSSTLLMLSCPRTDLPPTSCNLVGSRSAAPRRASAEGRVRPAAARLSTREAASGLCYDACRACRSHSSA
eukprot:scaffold136056_cov211-Phaeocystis_antarctica.AAC.2